VVESGGLENRSGALGQNNEIKQILLPAKALPIFQSHPISFNITLFDAVIVPL
jgi:hypothetical protein